MRVVVARRSGRRGEGLGNEMLPWAKGWIASQALNARLVGPSWGLNRRRYYRNFRSSRLDFVLEDLLAHVPHHTFTKRDYYATGEIDFDKAILKWARDSDLLARRSFVVTVDGMYGGYASIRNARPFLWTRLLESRNALKNVYHVLSTLDRDKLFVAVHMRLGGGFRSVEPGENERGRFNMLIPGEWYLNACQALRDQFGERVQFYFLTDCGGPAFDEAVRRFNPGQQRSTGLTECSDLLLMSMADLRICSLSSYSLAASFLSDGPYLWYEPQLVYEDNMYTLWGMEPEQRQDYSPTAQSIGAMREAEPGSAIENCFKGYPLRSGDAIPRGLQEQLHQRLLAKDRSANLLEYGCVPDWATAGAYAWDGAAALAGAIQGKEAGAAHGG